MLPKAGGDELSSPTPAPEEREAKLPSPPPRQCSAQHSCSREIFLHLPVNFPINRKKMQLMEVKLKLFLVAQAY